MSTDFKRVPASVNKFSFLSCHWLNVCFNRKSTGMSLNCSVQSIFCCRFLPFRATRMEVEKNCEKVTFSFASVCILCIYNSFVFLSDLFDFREVMLI